MTLSFEKSGSILVAVILAGCGPKPPTNEPPTPAEPETPVVAAPATEPEPEKKPEEPPPPPEAKLLRVTVVSAEIEGRMPNGENWDSKGSSALDGVPKPILRYLSLHPELSETATLVGVPIEAEKLEQAAKKSVAADPMVFVEIGDAVFRSPVQVREFNPLWEYPFLLLVGKVGDRQGIETGSVARIHVVDFDGTTSYDIIGSTLLQVDELMSKPVHLLGPFGSVKRLTIQVETRNAPSADTEPSTHRLAVPGNARWTDTGIDLVAGQRIAIDAADEVCSKGGSLSHCSGPEGQRKTSKYNLRGFEKTGHAALVGALGDTRFPVLRRRTLVVPSSGRLRLGVNDKDVKDNRGSYAVRVTIEPLP